MIGLYLGCYGKLAKIFLNLLKLQNLNHFYLASYTAAVIAQKKIENRRLLKGPSTGGNQSSSFSLSKGILHNMSLLYASLKMAKGYENCNLRN